MKFRSSSKIYRNIYKNHYGEIPVDDTGRTYEIHHIDGDHTNNDPLNLKAVTIQEHYNIHYSQGDWAECYFMSLRMAMTAEEISELSKKTQLKRIDSGTHHLLAKGSKHPKYDNTLYVWHNIKTNEIVTMTQYDFCNKFELSKQAVNNLVNANRKTYKMWRLHTNEPYINNKFDNTKYVWKNIKTSEIVELTQFEFCKKFNLMSSNVSRLAKGKAQKHKDWTILLK